MHPLAHSVLGAFFLAICCCFAWDLMWLRVRKIFLLIIVLVLLLTLSVYSYLEMHRVCVHVGFLLSSPLRRHNAEQIMG